MGLLHSYKEIHQVNLLTLIILNYICPLSLLHSTGCYYLPSFSGEFDMLESESDTLRFVSSWHSDAESECDADPDCVAIVKEGLLLII